jgi:nucleotidyltransferase substrate binding protein (TIGR01987 family)
MTVDLGPLRRTIGALQEALFTYQSRTTDESLRVLLRDATIQRFEFTFEVAWKTLKRFLEENSIEPIDRLTNRQLFRLGFEQGLLRDSAAWMLYLGRRNPTSHVYSEAIAAQVFEVIPEFLEDARFLLAQLERRLGEDDRSSHA